MKHMKLRAPILGLVILFGLQANAQPGSDFRGRGQRGEGYGRGEMARNKHNLPDLTEEQQSSIRQIHLDFQKQTLQMNNQIREKEAQLRTQMTNEKVNQGQIDKLVEEIGALNTSVAKARTATHMKVRAVLTEDQRILFDQRGMRRGTAYGNRGPAGMGRGYGLRDGSCLRLQDQ